MNKFQVCQKSFYKSFLTQAFSNLFCFKGIKRSKQRKALALPDWRKTLGLVMVWAESSSRTFTTGSCKGIVSRESFVSFELWMLLRHQRPLIGKQILISQSEYSQI